MKQIDFGIVVAVFVGALTVQTHAQTLNNGFGQMFHVKVHPPPAQDRSLRGQHRIDHSVFDFSLLCADGIPLLMEDHKPRPCQPRPWLKEHRCPTGFWCHEGQAEASFYCCPSSRKFANRCHLPPAVGYGKQRMRRFYFDWKTDACHELQYSGIGGNENSFMDYEKCENACRGAGEPPISLPSNMKILPKTPEQKVEKERPTEKVEKKVVFPKEASAGISLQPPSTPIGTTPKKNEKEIYEVFYTVSPETTTHHTPTTSETVADVLDPNPCVLAPERGFAGSLAISMWYFDQTSSSCSPFLYLGKGGNSNRFESSEHCMDTCGIGKPTRKSCELPPAIGNGPFNIPRYYFDRVTKKCERFFYSGRDGNDNRFYKKNKCERLCLKKKPKKKENIYEYTTPPPITIPAPAPSLPPPSPNAPIRIVQNLKPIDTTTSEPIILTDSYVYQTSTESPMLLPKTVPVTVEPYVETYTTSEVTTRKDSEEFEYTTAHPTLIYEPRGETLPTIAPPPSPPPIATSSDIVDHVFSSLMNSQQHNLAELVQRPNSMITTESPRYSSRERVPFGQVEQQPIPPMQVYGSAKITENKYGMKVEPFHGSSNDRFIPQYPPSNSQGYVAAPQPAVLQPQPISVAAGPAPHTLQVLQNVTSTTISHTYSTTSYSTTSYSTTTTTQTPPTTPIMIFPNTTASVKFVEKKEEEEPIVGSVGVLETSSEPPESTTASPSSSTSPSPPPYVYYSTTPPPPLVFSYYATSSQPPPPPPNQFETSTPLSSVPPSSPPPPVVYPTIQIQTVPPPPPPSPAALPYPSLISQVVGSRPQELHQLQMIASTTTSTTTTTTPIPTLIQPNYTFVTSPPIINDSPCRLQIFGDATIMCESRVDICPIGTFCQIGHAQSICCPILAEPPCEQPIDVGVGTSLIRRWYFDPATRLCQPFQFKGFKGNQNNFINYDSCNRACGATNVCPNGPPELSIHTHLLSCASDYDCPQLYSCTQSTPHNLCCAQVAPAPAPAPMPAQVSYPISSQTGIGPTLIQESQLPTNLIIDYSSSQAGLCDQPIDVGYGHYSEHRWAFSNGQCISFLFGGQGGNMNNFLTRSDCQNHCQNLLSSSSSSAKNQCSQPAASGHGEQYLSRYFFSPEYRQCLHFIYSGEGGNPNNFETLNDCLEQCVANGVKFSSLAQTAIPPLPEPQTLATSAQPPLPPPRPTPTPLTFSLQPKNVCPQGEPMVTVGGTPIQCDPSKAAKCPGDHVCTPVGQQAYCCPSPMNYCLQSRPPLQVCTGPNFEPVAEIRFTYDPMADRCIRFSFQNCRTSPTFSQSSLNVFKSNSQCNRLCCNQGYNLVYKRRLLMAMNDDPMLD